MSHPHDEYPPTRPSGQGPWPPVVPGAAGGAYPPPAVDVPHYLSGRPPLPPGAAVPNVFVWLLVGVLPVMLFMLILEILWMPGFFKATAAHDTARMTGYGFEVVLFFAAALVLRAAIIVFGFFDWRRLRKAGVVRPFHWAWIFLGPEVYMIGRSVILWKVSRNRVLAPMIAFGIGYLVLVVAGFAAGFTIVGYFESPEGRVQTLVQQVRDLKHFPVQVDSVTSWTGVEAEGDAVRYDYVISSSVDPATITAAAIRGSVLPRVCSVAEKKNGLDTGVKLRFVYTFEGSTKSLDFTLTKADCPIA